MKKRNVRVLTEKDLEGSEHKLSSMSEFDKLVEVCRVASELYDQQKQNNVAIFDIRCSVDKSFGKRPVSTHDQESNREALFSSRTCCITGGEELFNVGRKKSRGETSLSSRYYEYANVRRSWGDHDDQVVTEEVLGKKRKCYDSKDEDFEYYDQVVNERVLGKKRNCHDLKEDDFVYYDRVVNERVLGKKRNCYDWKDEKFEYCDQVVKEKILGKKRKCYDLKDENFECSEKKEKEPRIDNKLRYKAVETAPLPVEFANEIQRLGGNDVRLLIQKSLTATDLAKDKNRFNIPTKRVREEAQGFLTEAEEKKLNQRDADNGIVGMQVPLIEPNLNRSHINFKKWPVSKSFWYVLCTSWTAIQTSNHLQVGTDLQVWSFRVNGDLNLALVKVPQDMLQI